MRLEFLETIKPVDSATRYVIDKQNPGNYEIAAILCTALPNAKFIHLQRHPVDNLLSIWMTPLSANVRFASDKSNLVFTYREHMRLVKRWKESAASRSVSILSLRGFDIRSESDDPDRCFDYLDLEHEEACFTPEKNERFVLTPSVYQVRQPIHRGSQERWRNYQPWLGEFAELLDEL